MTTPLDPPPVDDFLQLDDDLSDQERAVRDTVRRFVAERVLPDIAEHYDRGEFPRHLIGEMGALGLLGMHLDGYGCAGTSAFEYGLACRELEAGDTGVRSFVSVQGSLAMFPIHAFGSDEQRTRWLPPMAAGELVGCFGLTEHDSGSDPSNMVATARRDGSDWILDGHKMWITNGGIADVAVVWARDTGSGRIRGFLVPTDTPGFQANPVRRKLSLRASVTSELVFDRVRLPADAVLPGVEGMRGPLSCLSEARYGIVWGAAGSARACYRAALDYAMTRQQFGAPIASFQLTQAKLVEMMVAATKAGMVAMRLGRLKDAGTLTPQQVSFGKFDNVRVALEVARMARTVHGANGVTADYPPLRHAANLESVLTYEGTNEIHTLILGQALTGIAAFR